MLAWTTKLQHEHNATIVQVWIRLPSRWFIFRGDFWYFCVISVLVENRTSLFSCCVLTRAADYLAWENAWKHESPSFGALRGPVKTNRRLELESFLRRVKLLFGECLKCYIRKNQSLRRWCMRTVCAGLGKCREILKRHAHNQLIKIMVSIRRTRDSQPGLVKMAQVYKTRKRCKSTMCRRNRGCKMLQTLS